MGKDLKKALIFFARFSLVVVLILFGINASGTNIDELLEPIDSTIRGLLDSRDRLPQLGPAPEFSLTSSEEKELNSAELKGKVWVVNFFTTRCQKACANQAKEIDTLSRIFEGAHFLSISLDPDHDSPEVLKDFAAKHAAPHVNWHFLVGEKNRVTELMKQGFVINPSTVAQSPSDQIVLIDREGMIRGYYDSADPDAMEALKHAILEVT